MTSFILNAVYPSVYASGLGGRCRHEGCSLSEVCRGVTGCGTMGDHQLQLGRVPVIARDFSRLLGQQEVIIDYGLWCGTNRGLGAGEVNKKGARGCGGRSLSCWSLPYA